MKRLLALLLASTLAHAEALPPLQVHASGHQLQAGGKPFLWLGDTAWELMRGTTRAETSYYLATRARQGFSLVQTTVLAESDNLLRPNAQGLIPFEDRDTDKPNAAYFRRVAEVVDEAAARGLYVALLPTWGDKLEASWGTGPALFKLDDLPRARRYAAMLAGHLKGRSNVVWMLGGDRPPRIDASSPEWLRALLKEKGRSEIDWRPIWRAMAQGIREVLPEALIAFHPAGGLDGTAELMHDEPWLAIHGMQSGHGAGFDVPIWEAVTRDISRPHPKPVLDLEPNYEDHPVSPWPAWNPALGYFRDHDVRKQVYRAVFAGAAGVTYGHHAVWQFTGERNPPINFPDRDWRDALQRPGARQLGLLRALLASRASWQRRPLQALLSFPATEAGCHARANGDPGAGFLMVYAPCAEQALTLDLRAFAGKALRAWWWDPRTGIAQPAGEPRSEAAVAFRTPAHGPDWVLVVDDTGRGLPLPGL